MDTPSFGMLDFVSPGTASWDGEVLSPPAEHRMTVSVPLDTELLRRCAWEIGEERAADAYAPAGNHVGMAAVTPHQGFVHWRILPEWVEQTARQRGGAWHNCRLVVRIYDVSYIQFTGLNAHRVQDEHLPGLCGQRFFQLPRSGTFQLAEVGFVLRSGEFIPSARSRTVQFARDTGSPNRDQTALFVDERGRIEPVGNIWEQANFLRERHRPKLRHPLRIAAFAFAPNGDGMPSPFVRELAVHQRALGHEVHVLVAAADAVDEASEVDGVRYHPLPLHVNGSPLETAQAFARAAEKYLQDAPPFDLLHHHEWLTGLAAPVCAGRVSCR